VFLDITASSDERKTMVDGLVERTAASCFMPLTVGGGIRTVDDMRTMLLAGADKVGVNTAALFNPGVIDEAAEAFGCQRLVVAIDAKRNERGSWTVYTHGGTQARDRATQGGRCHRVGGRRSAVAAQAKSCSPAWTPTAPRRATTLV